ncbi:LLM class F420-dependent oxidoreductase [Dietzia sp. NCCP-2495]|uniref:TIGR03619 family F420-dependent LLM class oxidoreductase n=1 Tax=Dietzia sp. NCCP-2495 TaxID=2934675 RepID=UPI002230AB1D|nr:TIGR03619 family F420-dependent LLM class oxidoreductase [Dietzia sp. NCCP-2495]GLB65061.1 LLM class F420-dependent oxidoreductase [Dietzia sp. NCCP-2495]
MKFAVSTAWIPHEQLAPIAKAADELGYSSLALPDHVVDIADIQTPYPYTEDGSRRWATGAEWPDPWVTVGHLAAVTSRVRFFTSVYIAAMRSPYQVAKTVGTAAVLSGNRVTLGVGVGWCREEFDLLEQPFGTRGRRTDEALELIRRLWAPGDVEYEGQFWNTPKLTMEPTPSERVPIYVGGISDAGFARAARYDGWVGDLCTIDEGARWAAALRAERDKIGATGEFQVIVALTDAITPDDFRRARQLGMTETMTAPWAYYYELDATLEQKLDGMARFSDDVISPLAHD